MATVTSKSVKQIGHGMMSAYSSGTTTIAVSFQSTFSWNLHELRFHLSTGKAEGSTFTVVVNSSLGGVHDVEIVRQAMVNVKDLHYLPTRPVRLSAGDTLDCSWVDETTSKWGLEAIFDQDR